MGVAASLILGFFMFTPLTVLGHSLPRPTLSCRARPVADPALAGRARQVAFPDGRVITVVGHVHGRRIYDWASSLGPEGLASLSQEEFDEQIREFLRDGTRTQGEITRDNGYTPYAAYEIMVASAMLLDEDDGVEPLPSGLFDTIYSREYFDSFEQQQHHIEDEAYLRQLIPGGGLPPRIGFLGNETTQKQRKCCRCEPHSGPNTFEQRVCRSVGSKKYHIDCRRLQSIDGVWSYGQYGNSDE
jgi:hypothetical protein